MFDLSWAGLLSFVITAVLPLLVAALARTTWSGTAKGLLLLALSAVKAIIEGVLTPGHGSVSGIVAMVAANFLIAVGMHFGLLRGSTVQTGLLALGSTPPPPRY
jgi:hypothetical protein